MNKPAWKRLSSGKYVDLNDLKPEDIVLSDINTALNNVWRFNGHHSEVKPLTVAQHTRLCMILAEQFYPEDKLVALAVLMHDWPEAYYGDIATPVKRVLGKVLRDWTDKIDEVVNFRYWPYISARPWFEIEDAVKVCDLASLDIERRTMWKNPQGKDKWPKVPSELTLKVVDKTELYHLVASEPFNIEEAYNDLVDIHKNTV